jgi:hypothetical protein
LQEPAISETTKGNTTKRLTKFKYLCDAKVEAAALKMLSEEDISAVEEEASQPSSSMVLPYKQDLSKSFIGFYNLGTDKLFT